jgi:hypothetical protein
MTQTEALRLALEALEKTQAALAQCFGSHKSEEGDRHRALAYSRTTITAIKAALANEALERKAENARELGLDYEPPEAKDEPVAWMRTSGTGSPIVTEDLLVEMPEMRWNFQQPLYTTPPQRTWVGLTDEDLKLLSAEWRIVYGAWMDDFAKEIEAKLKEKNT